MNSINSTNLSDKNIKFKYKINSYKFLEKDIQKLDTIFSTLLISNETNIEDNSSNFSYEIESDTQYFESDVFCRGKCAGDFAKWSFKCR